MNNYDLEFRTVNCVNCLKLIGDKWVSSGHLKFNKGGPNSFGVNHVCCVCCNSDCLEQVTNKASIHSGAGMMGYWSNPMGLKCVQIKWDDAGNLGEETNIRLIEGINKEPVFYSGTSTSPYHTINEARQFGIVEDKKSIFKRMRSFLWG